MLSLRRLFDLQREILTSSWKYGHGILEKVRPGDKVLLTTHKVTEAIVSASPSPPMAPLPAWLLCSASLYQVPQDLTLDPDIKACNNCFPLLPPFPLTFVLLYYTSLHYLGCRQSCCKETPRYNSLYRIGVYFILIIAHCLQGSSVHEDT